MSSGQLRVRERRVERKRVKVNEAGSEKWNGTFLSVI